MTIAAALPTPPASAALPPGVNPFSVADGKPSYQSGTVAPGPEAAAAAARHAELMQSKAFQARIGSSDPIVKAQAWEESTQLVKQFSGMPGDAPPAQPQQQPGNAPAADPTKQQQPDAAAPAVELPLHFDPGSTLEKIAATRADAAQAMTSMQAPPELATAFVSTIRDAQLARAVPGPDGKAITARPMDSGELVTMESHLRSLWGDGYDARSELAAAALRSAGKHAEWIRQSILSAGPRAAAWAMASLADHGSRLKAR